MLTKKSWLTFSVAAGAALVLALGSPLKAELSIDEREQRLSAIAADARSLHDDAMEMERTLKAKKPDLESVRSMLDEISTNIDKLGADVLALESASPAWASGSEAYQKMKTKAELLKIFASNKAAMLDAADALKNRRVLAAKAKGIALRADMLCEYAAPDAD